ncbi:MAG: HD domain-containing protein [Clostridia bacterium]|nr:HD domain-containing protein [Clostridia bacterium]MBQ8840993.1 HD domain-containing protein [Clostridia bacterium]
MITYNDIKHNEKIRAYIKKADESLLALGFTEHGFAHVTLVAERAGKILQALGYDEKTIELAKISAFMHDIGNIVNRREHSQSGAVMAFRILDNLNLEPNDIADIVTAIGNHDEGTGEAVNPISASLIIADKTDVRRTRVRVKPTDASFDIHDRVNYSVYESHLDVDKEAKTITLCLKIDTEISDVMSYFEIFTERMLMCKKAANALGTHFKLTINDQAIM